MAKLSWQWALVIVAALAATAVVYVFSPPEAQGDIWVAFASIVSFVVGGGVGEKVTIRSLKKAGSLPKDF